MMRLPVYTELLRVRRMVWHLGRWPLPRPITVTQLMVALGEALFLLWALSGGLLPVPASVPLGPIVIGGYLVAAVAGIHAAGQPLLDGLRLDQAALALLRHGCQPRDWLGGRPAAEVATEEGEVTNAHPAPMASEPAPFTAWPTLRVGRVSGNGHSPEAAS